MLDDAGTGTAPLVIVIEAAEEMLEAELATVVASPLSGRHPCHRVAASSSADNDFRVA